MRTPGPVRGSTRRGRREHTTLVPGRRRWRSQLAVGRSEEHPAAEGDVLLFRACCSWLRSFRVGAQTTKRSNCFLWTGQPATRLMNRRSIFNEKEAVRAHTGDEEGASTSSCPGATQVAPRIARDISNPSCARPRTTMASS